MKLSTITPIMLGLLAGPGQMAQAHQQISIKKGGHKFKLAGFDDGRSTPYRISFWDDSLTGSSYRFDGYGHLVYFKAGSKIYYDIHNDNSGVLAFSVKEESGVEKKMVKAEMHHERHDPFTCFQCSRMLSKVCDYGLPSFCKNVVLPSLGTDDGVASVSMLCDSADATCTTASNGCEDVCASGQ